MTIKTQGGKVITKDGKVSCECCCGCMFATPINPINDPNFTKKLTGNDPTIPAFTQVSINYNIAVDAAGSGSGSNASGSMSGGWVEAIGCAEINKVFQGNSCNFSNFCLGNCTQIPGSPSGGIASMSLRLLSNGCFRALLSEQFYGGFFYISNKCTDAELIQNGDTLANTGISVSINGVSTYIIYQSLSAPTDILTGYFNITFS